MTLFLSSTGKGLYTNGHRDFIRTHELNKNISTKIT